MKGIKINFFRVIPIINIPLNDYKIVDIRVQLFQSELQHFYLIIKEKTINNFIFFQKLIHFR